MKRVGYIYEKLCTLENLQLAFWKAQRGKSERPAVVKFRNNLAVNLEMMRESLLQENIDIGKYTHFEVFDPKRRTICAAAFPERILHHAIMNVCEETFERYAIADSFACRKGKGVDACLHKAQKLALRYEWYAKVDVKKFFDSIDHLLLKKQLARRFKDEQLLRLMGNIIDSYRVDPKREAEVEKTHSTDRSMAVVPGRARGLPIGNLLSQHFGNLMLGVLDHVVKEQIGVAGYVRYMDDMLFFGEDKKNLARQVAQATSFLRKELLLEPHPVVINRTRYGIPFLSYRITDNGLRLSQRAKQRFRKKIKVACKLKDAERGLALLSFIERANCEGFKRKVFYGDVL